ncbi:hypothetical protein QBC35DRAFT_506767 [Podospora australis]|uniref:Putative transcription factor kapC n=1 Tax=Podospora australis TaxID=1536484 RepID=A0AAN6WMH6_9PEZI|nr:hypothetical protein QBC35DRAFT_506767 [Podospora australis]
MPSRTRTKIQTTPENTQDVSASPDKQTSSDKAKVRRAQVRSAQIKHRQRKAEYIKELETEIEQLRNKIASTRKETHVLHKENQALLSQVQQSLPVLTSSNPNGPLLPSTGGPTPPMEEDITMTLGFDEILNSPCFYISSSPSSSLMGSTPPTTMDTTSPDQAAPIAPTLPCLPEMTPHQIQQAINFILALEHICRNHHHPPSIPFKSSSSPNNHILMASSLALRTAPEPVFHTINKTTLFGTPLMSFRPPSPDSEDAQVSWQTSGLTLLNLYGLACTLQADNIDIYPVQVWFELVARYGADVILTQTDELKKKLGKVVRCPRYGAVLDRKIFEKVVEEVLGGDG